MSLFNCCFQEDIRKKTKSQKRLDVLYGSPSTQIPGYNEKCKICNKQLYENDIIIILKCDHTVHSLCFNSLKRKHCPACS